MVDVLSCRGLFRSGQGTGNIDHGQQCEDIGLNEAGEKIEVTGQNSGDAVGQEGEIGENAGHMEQAGNAHHGSDDTKYQSDGLAALFPQQNQNDTHSEHHRTGQPAAGSDQLDDLSGSKAL